mmetsp:Transcript_28683/g.50490  ORF Transcript_28683/g.50490 Transcript_28683/m.50490 type:complete len:117 (-) Transcript_28683:275-625(-)|eukprot:CAMPEP_0197520164 /NCGR_PEP_ID=MMETSP1318-20131121/5477_1 /TAXON_ID=552666 /ORGANISM="Partenskyella glossopodia, Strain RCC365" /LENGTH=116 /DNA_ID=CAMNT_0043071573 /DNA_START=148 /DNA_END=498 /DNA_ORIENTATION=-
MAKQEKKGSSDEGLGRWCFGCAKPLIGSGGKNEKDDPQFLKVLLLGGPAPASSASKDKDSAKESFWPEVEPFRIVRNRRVRKQQSPGRPRPTLSRDNSVSAKTSSTSSTTSEKSGL